MCRYVSSASLETLGQAFKDATLLMERNYDIFYEELKLSCYQPEVGHLSLPAYRLHIFNVCCSCIMHERYVLYDTSCICVT